MAIVRRITRDSTNLTDRCLHRLSGVGTPDYRLDRINKLNITLQATNFVILQLKQ